MGKSFRVQILSSEKTMFAAEIVSLVVPGSEGHLGVLAHHAALITALVPGPLVLTHPGGRREVFATSSGFLEVAGNRVVILADALERPAEIDVARARASEERARGRLRERRAGLDSARAEASLRRALGRRQVAARWAAETAGAGDHED